MHGELLGQVFKIITPEQAWNPAEMNEKHLHYNPYPFACCLTSSRCLQQQAVLVDPLMACSGPQYLILGHPPDWTLEFFSRQLTCYPDYCQHGLGDLPVVHMGSTWKLARNLVAHRLPQFWLSC